MTCSTMCKLFLCWWEPIYSKTCQRVGALLLHLNELKRLCCLSGQTSKHSVNNCRVWMGKKKNCFAKLVYNINDLIFSDKSLSVSVVMSCHCP